MRTIPVSAACVARGKVELVEKGKRSKAASKVSRAKIGLEGSNGERDKGEVPVSSSSPTIKTGKARSDEVSEKTRRREFTGRWTTEEHAAFLEGLRRYGKQWKLIGLSIPTRTVVQIRTHAQKYFQKVAKAKKKLACTKMTEDDYRRATSIAMTPDTGDHSPNFCPPLPFK